MMIRAKVQQNAVHEFRSAAGTVVDLAVRFDQGIQCLEAFAQYIRAQCDKARNADAELQRASGIIQTKISETEDRIEQVEQELRGLRSEIDRVEDELSSTPETMEREDENGALHSSPNPDYSDLEDELSELQDQYSDLQGKRSRYRDRLHRQQQLASKIDTQISELRSTIALMEGQEKECCDLRSTLMEVKASVDRCGRTAVGCLEKIEQTIDRYTTIKMQSEAVRSYRSDPNAPLAEVLAGLISFCFHVAKAVIERTLAGQTPDPAETAKIRKDDKGKAYRVGDDLIERNTFEVNGYTYRTDNQGRTMSVSGRLTLVPKHDRSMEKMHVVGKGDQLETDDIGHLVGHRFNGSDKLENLIPQDMDINRGAYKKLEDHLAKQVEAGHVVYADIRPVFPLDSKRPDFIAYRYTIDGETRTQIFPNTSKEAH